MPKGPFHGGKGEHAKKREDPKEPAKKTAFGGNATYLTSETISKDGRDEYRMTRRWCPGH